MTLAFFSLAWSGLLLAVGLKTKKAETVSAVGNLLVFPLLFVSSALFPISIMPAWAQTVSDYNPLSYVSNVTRGLVQGGVDLEHVWVCIRRNRTDGSTDFRRHLVSIQKSRQLKEYKRDR